MGAIGVIGGDVTKVDVAGDTMTGPLILPDASPAASQAYVAAHEGGGGGGSSVLIVDSGLITSGAVTVTSGAFTQLAPDLSIPAAVGDWLEVTVHALAAATSGYLTMDVATRASGADVHYLSTGTSSARRPGTYPGWYFVQSVFQFAGPPVAYQVQAADVVTGAVTLRLYAGSDGADRVIHADATFPLRWSVLNLGAGS